MTKYFVDTNIILRYLLGEDSSGKIAKLVNGSAWLVIPDIVVAEVVWTLDRFYKWPKLQIVEFVTALLKRDKTEFNEKIISNSLNLFLKHNIKFTDAYIATLMMQQKVANIYSFDRDFSRMENIARLEPK